MINVKDISNDLNISLDEMVIMIKDEICKYEERKITVKNSYEKTLAETLLNDLRKILYVVESCGVLSETQVFVLKSIIRTNERRNINRRVYI